LEPLPPRYVSTVDNGNLAGALLALRQGCQTLASAPVMRAQRWYGLTRGTNIGGLGGPRPFTIASDIASPVTTANPNAASRPICMHPTKAVFVGSDPLVAASYNCT